MRRALLRALAVTVTVGQLGAMSGCAAAKVATCSEYAAMAADTGLLSDINDEQRAAIKTALRAHSKTTDEGNVMVAALQIVAYCNIYGGRAGSNATQPIDGIPGLKG